MCGHVVSVAFTANKPACFFYRQYPRLIFIKRPARVASRRPLKRVRTPFRGTAMSNAKPLHEGLFYRHMRNRAGRFPSSTIATHAGPQECLDFAANLRPLA